jgi:hypothetical protein
MWIYLAFLGILCLFFVQKFEPFEDRKKGMLVLYGESFRSGDNGSRTRDCEECVETQKIASQSHQDFIRFVQEKYNITLDVLIDTYDTLYQEELKSYYNSPDYYSHKELLGWDGICQHAVNNIDKSHYEFILLTRIDIFIKPEFYNVFNPSWEKIYFLSTVEPDDTPTVKCGFSKSETGIYYPKINPTFVFFPSSYYDALQQVSVDHEAWFHYMKTYQLTEKDMGLMVDYQFNANSASRQNPYYKMVGRPESTILMDKNLVITYPLISPTQPSCSSLKT